MKPCRSRRSFSGYSPRDGLRPLRCTNRRDKHGKRPAQHCSLAGTAASGGPVRRSLETTHFVGRFLDLLRQPIVFIALSAEEGARDVELLLDTARSEDVQVRRFVVAVAEVTNLYPPLLDERLEAVVGLADADPEDACHLPLRGGGVLLDITEKAAADLVSRLVTHPNRSTAERRLELYQHSAPDATLFHRFARGSTGRSNSTAMSLRSSDTETTRRSPHGHRAPPRRHRAQPRFTGSSRSRR